VLEAVEAALDDIVAAVDGPVGAGWPAAACAAVQPAESVAGEAGFRAQSTAGSAEGVITRFVPVDRSFLPSAAC
jgi:hypothetical protein